MKLQQICGLLLAASSIATAYVFAYIWFQDAIQICEPNIWFRTLELIASISLVVFGLYCLFHREKNDTSNKP